MTYDVWLNQVNRFLFSWGGKTSVDFPNFNFMKSYEDNDYALKAAMLAMEGASNESEIVRLMK